MPSTQDKIKLHASLKPVRPDSVDRKTTSPDERIEEAFGQKLWDPFQGPLPGTTALWAARKRLSKRNLPSEHLNPTELLEFLGVVKTPATARLFEIVEGAARDKLPGVLTVSLATKWFANLAIPAKPLSDFDSLSSENPTVEVGGAIVRFLAHDERSPREDGDCDEEGGKQGDEKDPSFEEKIEEALTSDVPHGHRRFFHGTDSVSAFNIINDCTRQARFENKSDFGPALYTTENCNIAFMFSIYAAAICSGRAAILSFDVPEADYNDLKDWQLKGAEWTNVVSLCHLGDFHKAFAGQDNIEVVVGDMSHRVGGSDDGSSVRPFKGMGETAADYDFIQHAFRGNSSNILTADMAKVRALLFSMN